MKVSLGKVNRGDCLKGLGAMDAGIVDLVFADPPFNIGYKYDKYDDCQDHEKYLAWSRDWMRAVYRVLKPNGAFWLAIGDEYAAELKLIAQNAYPPLPLLDEDAAQSTPVKLSSKRRRKNGKSLPEPTVGGFHCRSWVIWYYTFGVHCTHKFTRSHAHLFHFVKDPKDFTFNADAVRVPSARQLVYADKRANPKGRVPDDTWILRPQDHPEGFTPDSDTWYFSRVAGTFKEREGWHGCQMPEQLLGRIIKACSNEGDVVLDPFTGSGTTLVAAKKLGREFVGCEMSEEYAKYARSRLHAAKAGDLLDGVEEPLVSAPATVGRASSLRTVQFASGKKPQPAVHEVQKTFGF